MSDRKGKKWINDGIREFTIPGTSVNQYLIDNPKYKLGRLKSSEETCRKISDAKRGKKLSKSHKSNISKTLRRKKVNVGRKASKETRDKQSKAKLGKTPNRVYIVSEETRVKLSLSHMGHTQSDHARKKIGISTRYRLRNKPEPFVSKTEVKIRTYLSNYFKVESQYRIPGSYNHAYDLLVHLNNGIKLLIEYDGDYWHSEDNPYWSLDRDLERGTKAIESGYQFLVVKESEFYKDDKGLYRLKQSISEFYPEFINMHLNGRL